MVKEYWDKATSSRFTMHLGNKCLKGLGLQNVKPEPLNTFAYNTGEEQIVTIDEINYSMPSQSILPLVSSQHFSFENAEEIIAWQFNRGFYCLVDHDKEVGCAGFLFCGIQHPMFIKLNQIAQGDIMELKVMFLKEWEKSDRFQGEMLRTILKKMIIQVTRIAKQQTEIFRDLDDERTDLLRHLSLLIDKHYKEQHEVKFYARTLNKSAKTLTNILAIAKLPSPSKLIQSRIIIEAKRHLLYTDKSAKEIAFALGFTSASHFSRFFKQHSGTSITQFKYTNRN